MVGLVKRFLKVFGHALTAAAHERLDHVDHALDLVIDQNNRMARSQTALLQSSIHIVNALNRLQADVNGLKKSAAQLTGQSAGLVEAADRTLADVVELKKAAERQVELIERGE